jgi:hypothetical protein
LPLIPVVGQTIYKRYEKHQTRRKQYKNRQNEISIAAKDDHRLEFFDNVDLPKDQSVGSLEHKKGER